MPQHEAGTVTEYPRLSSSAGISRRLAIAMFTSLPAFGLDTARAESSLSKAAFLDASGLVTGVEPTKLTALTDALLAVFEAQRPVILRLAALTHATPPADLTAAIAGTPMAPVAKALAAAWYTATIGTGATTHLISFEDALVWKVAGFDSTPGSCAGEFGFWAEPPAPLQ